jgi:hypothetical protein
MFTNIFLLLLLYEITSCQQIAEWFKRDYFDLRQFWSPRSSLHTIALEIYTFFIPFETVKAEGKKREGSVNWWLKHDRNFREPTSRVVLSRVFNFRFQRLIYGFHKRKKANRERQAESCCDHDYCQHRTLFVNWKFSCEVFFIEFWSLMIEFLIQVKNHVVRMFNMMR